VGLLLSVRYFLFKPDGIGDFVLATGAIDLLAREAGEENLVICVRSLLAPLAKAQFPQATIIELPVAEKRKVVNLFALNFIRCLPVWRELRAQPVDGAACFRSMRNYLHTFLFYSARASRFVACENLLVRSRRASRVFVEELAQRLVNPELLPYPEPQPGVPSEIEANRLVVAQLLQREVDISEVLPVLKSPDKHAAGPWVCCPLSSMESKDYPFESWRALLEPFKSEIRDLLLVGSEHQRARLTELEAMLREAGILGARVFIPENLVAFVNVIAQSSMVLCVDTAAAHIATALDKRCVVLFSEMHAGMFGPWKRSENQVWLTPEFPDGKKRKWHKGIPPDRAGAYVRSLLI
jgi:ADP-heptose:LPS heptosyltransferase